jgi:hypothetical protein
MAGAWRAALSSGGGGSASCKSGIGLLWSLVRAVVFAAVLMVSPNWTSPPKGVCEEFHRETMAMFVEQMLAKEAGARGRSFETSALERVLSTDCGG